VIVHTHVSELQTLHDDITPAGASPAIRDVLLNAMENKTCCSVTE